MTSQTKQPVTPSQLAAWKRLVTRLLRPIEPRPVPVVVRVLEAVERGSLESWE
jgi:hypothetical protein